MATSSTNRDQGLCSACGSRLPEAARFCDACGVAVGDRATRGSPAAWPWSVAMLAGIALVSLLGGRGIRGFAASLSRCGQLGGPCPRSLEVAVECSRLGHVAALHLERPQVCRELEGALL